MTLNTNRVELLNRPSNTTNDGIKLEKLVLMFSYMMAKERHLDKYRLYYLNNGYDVLTINTRPIDFLYPPIGSRKIAQNLLTTLNKTVLNPKADILVHGFSVGGYQFAEFLDFLKSKASHDENSRNMLDNIRGTIFDSPCDIDSVPYGFSRTVAGDTLLANVIESSVRVHNNLLYRVSKKYHELGAHVFEHKPLPCPSLFLVSNDDKLADINVVRRVATNWKKLGVNVSMK